MIRLIGVLTGSALAIGLLLLVLGVPELAGRSDADEFNAPSDPARVATPQASHEPLASPEIVPEALATDEPEPMAEPEPLSEAEPLLEAESMAEAESVAEPEPVIESETVPASTTANVPRPESDVADMPAVNETPAQNWYAFWSPFRSRIAADGFVSELSRTTGLDYRVVKLKPGVYEVAVAYTDDADIEDKLTRIAAATGLDMSGG